MRGGIYRSSRSTRGNGMSDNESPQAASDGEGATRHTGRQSIFQLATNLAAAGAVLLTGFALTKAYAVGHFSLTTGAALLTAAPVAVLLGSLMSYAYWGVPTGKRGDILDRVQGLEGRRVEWAGDHTPGRRGSNRTALADTPTAHHRARPRRLCPRFPSPRTHGRTA